MKATDVSITIESDTSAFEAALSELESLAEDFPRAIDSLFKEDPLRLFVIDSTVKDGVIKAVWKPSTYLREVVSALKLSKEQGVTE